MVIPEKPFDVKKRLLKQPLTTNFATNVSRQEVLGRIEFGKEHADLGEDLVKSIVFPRFCKTLRDISTERMSMKKMFLQFSRRQK